MQGYGLRPLPNEMARIPSTSVPEKVSAALGVPGDR